LYLSIGGAAPVKYQFNYQTYESMSLFNRSGYIVSGRFSNVEEDWARPTDPFRLIFVNGVLNGGKANLHLHITKKD